MKENRSIFWPLTLIAAGVIWFLVIRGTVPAANLWALTHIWPYVLIALGVGMILRTLWKPFGGLVSALVVIGAVAAIFFAPKMGWADAPAWGWNIGDSNFSGAIKGSGVMKTQTRELSDFDSIAIRYPAEVIVRQGKTASVKIEADDNLLPQLTTEVEGDTLILENGESNYSERVRPTSAVKVTITVTELKEISLASAGSLEVIGVKGGDFELKLSGAGDVRLTEVEFDSFVVTLSGMGEIVVDGKAERLKLTISGLGDFKGADLQTMTADVLISGAGDATVRVEEELTARVSGAGSVGYYGSPEVTKTISGAGNVDKKGE
jgi:hypothetical protein